MIVSGFQSGNDAVVHARLLVRPAAGGADQVLATLQSSGVASDAGAGYDIDQVVSQPAVAATCGDRLILAVTVVSGSTPFIELSTSVDIP